MLKRVLVFLGITTLVSGVSYYLYKQYDLVKNWGISVVKLRVVGYTEEQLSLKVTLRVINPSSVEAVVDKLDCRLFINDEFTATISQTNVMPIPAHGYNNLEINATIENSEFLNQLLNFTSTGNPVSLHTIGTLRVSSGFIKATVPIDDTSIYTLADIIK